MVQKSLIIVFLGAIFSRPPLQALDCTNSKAWPKSPAATSAKTRPAKTRRLYKGKPFPAGSSGCIIGPTIYVFTWPVRPLPPELFVLNTTPPVLAWQSQQ
jgi:hypothetical protein